jgi:5,10-methylenetetrahydrofolate reductase
MKKCIRDQKKQSEKKQLGREAVQMEGHDMAGDELKGSPRFCMDAVVNPGAGPLEPQIIKMEKKIEAGATFFQTQGVFEVGKFEKFIKATEYLNVPIMAGIIFLKSAGSALYMNKNVAGVFVPDDMISEISDTDSKVKTTIDIAARIIEGSLKACAVVCISCLWAGRSMSLQLWTKQNSKYTSH